MTYIEAGYAHITTQPCIKCGESSEIITPESEYLNWRGGMLIQNAFPTMPVDTREMLITGTHPECWEQMFAE